MVLGLEAAHLLLLTPHELLLSRLVRRAPVALVPHNNAHNYTFTLSRSCKVAHSNTILASVLWPISKCRRACRSFAGSLGAVTGRAGGCLGKDTGERVGAPRKDPSRHRIERRRRRYLRQPRRRRAGGGKRWRRRWTGVGKGGAVRADVAGRGRPRCAAAGWHMPRMSMSTPGALYTDSSDCVLYTAHPANIR